MQNDVVVLPSLCSRMNGLKVRRVLPSLHRQMVGPFIVLDQLGPMDLAPGYSFDMPPHPHIGLQAITYLVDGELLHRDNLGNVEVIRQGEVSWMTAGCGIAHSERTPPDVRASGGSLLGVQAWVALPSRLEEAAAEFAHYGASEIPRICADGVEFTLIAGASDGLISRATPFCDLICAEIVLTSGARYQVKPAHHERAIYVVAGEVEIAGRSDFVGEAELVLLKPGTEVILKAPAFHSARLMLIGGEPFAEPRHIWWNFVSSSVGRIDQAKVDWLEGRFPSVPGDDDLTPLPEASAGRR